MATIVSSAGSGMEGITLLMNPHKISSSSDSGSIASVRMQSRRGSGDGTVKGATAQSVRSVRISNEEDVGRRYGDDDDDDDDRDDSVVPGDDTTVRGPPPAARHRPSAPVPDHDYVSGDDDDDDDDDASRHGGGGHGGSQGGHGGGGHGGGGHGGSQGGQDVKAKLSPDEVRSVKRNLLWRLERLEHRNIRMPRRYTMESSLEEMQEDWDRYEHDRNVDNAIELQRKSLMLGVRGVEGLTSILRPVFDVRLKGWSTQIYSELPSYNDVFEELYEVHGNYLSMRPEYKLMLMLCGSALNFHFEQRKGSVPGMEEVMKHDPSLRQHYNDVADSMMGSKQYSSPTQQRQYQQQSPQSSQQQQQQQQQQPSQHQQPSQQQQQQQQARPAGPQFMDGLMGMLPFIGSLSSMMGGGGGPDTSRQQASERHMRAIPSGPAQRRTAAQTAVTPAPVAMKMRGPQDIDAMLLDLQADAGISRGGGHQRMDLVSTASDTDDDALSISVGGDVEDIVSAHVAAAPARRRAVNTKRGRASSAAAAANNLNTLRI